MRPGVGKVGMVGMIPDSLFLDESGLPVWVGKSRRVPHLAHLSNPWQARAWSYQLRQRTTGEACSVTGRPGSNMGQDRSGPAGVPSLNDLAADPSKAAGLPPDVTRALSLCCAAVLATLASVPAEG